MVEIARFVINVNSVILGDPFWTLYHFTSVFLCLGEASTTHGLGQCRTKCWQHIPHHLQNVLNTSLMQLCVRPHTLISDKTEEWAMQL